MFIHFCTLQVASFVTLQYSIMSYDTTQQVISPDLLLDDSDRPLDYNHVPPFRTLSIYGNTPVPMPTGSTSGWSCPFENMCHAAYLPGDWLPPESKTWPRRGPPENYVCILCGANRTPLWRRDDAGRHMCHSCSVEREEIEKGVLLKSKRTVTRREGTRCVNCDTAETTLWRKNSEGQLVCNACGLYYKLHKVNRPLTLKNDKIQTRKRKVTNHGMCHKNKSQSEPRTVWKDQTLFMK
ncbi:erythroid transcription factor [Cynoglossus semilaevis]|uniref:erythroid transcription factor n=1 Tax=Cynoglossus semilaevis TaxID=244447 RepID=UPI000D625BAC|nr:erythroid transcription factor [Cynoglossus semilaevis]